MKKLLFSFLLLTLWGGISIQARALSDEMALTDTLLTQIYFPINRTELHYRFKENNVRLTQFIKSLKSLQQMEAISKVKIISGASPEGPEAFNEELAKGRGETLRNYLMDETGLSLDRFTMISLGADWEGLEKLVRESDMPYKEEVLKALSLENHKARIPAIRKLDGGAAWRLLKKDFLPHLRAGQSIAIEVYVEKVKPTPEEVKEEPAPEPVPEPAPEPAPLPLEDPCTPFYMNLRTNLLYDLALIPNVGIEFYLGKGWSVLGNYQGAWWSYRPKHLFWRLYSGDLEVRRYFGKAAKDKPLTGHHLGLYGQIGSFDFELGKKGALCHLMYGGGISYGYSLPVARRLNIDFTIGFGYLHGDYDVYHPYFPYGQIGCYEWLETRTANWIAPTKAEITLVWQLGCDNINRKKGGRK